MLTSTFIHLVYGYRRPPGAASWQRLVHAHLQDWNTAPESASTTSVDPETPGHAMSCLPRPCKGLSSPGCSPHLGPASALHPQTLVPESQSLASSSRKRLASILCPRVAARRFRRCQQCWHYALLGALIRHAFLTLWRLVVAGEVTRAAHSMGGRKVR